MRAYYLPTYQSQVKSNNVMAKSKRKEGETAVDVTFFIHMTLCQSLNGNINIQ